MLRAHWLVSGSWLIPVSVILRLVTEVGPWSLSVGWVDVLGGDVGHSVTGVGAGDFSEMDGASVGVLEGFWLGFGVGRLLGRFVVGNS